MESKLEKYIKKIENKKISELDLDFEVFFSEVKKDLFDYQLEDFILLEKILEYYKIFRKCRENQDADCQDIEDQLYQNIIESGFYQKYLNDCFKINYPKCEESLYRLEFQFVAFLRNQEEKIDIDKYHNILYTLDYLSDFINEKTIYIAHNILLFYKHILDKEEYLSYENKKPIDNLYQSLMDTNSSYQKYKR